MRRAPFGPLISLAAVLVTTLLLGNLLAVGSSGRVMDDWNNTPIEGAQIRLGVRVVTLSDADGRFTVAGLPRGSMLEIRATTYRARTVSADNVGEVRMEPLTLNLAVMNASNDQPVKSPEARQADGTVIRVGTDIGDIAITHPGRDVPFLVCATGFATKELRTTLTHLTVKLDPDTSDKGHCPPVPSASPSPSPSPTPAPSGSPSASPSSSP